MSNKTYAITKEQRDEVMAYLKRKPLDMDGTDVVITLDLLPLITEEPSELLRDICELEAADESDVYAVRVRVKDLELVLARHFQPLQDPVAFEASDKLLGQYWDAAHKEGETGIPQSTEANDILHKMRQLVKPLQPITAEMVTDEMVTAYHKAHNGDYRKDIIVNAVNVYSALKNKPKGTQDE